MKKWSDWSIIRLIISTIDISCKIPFIHLTVWVNAACVVNWLDFLVDNTENDINHNWAKINPEKVLESLAGLKVEERVLLDACAQEISPAEYSVHDGHVGNKLPIILLQNSVGAESIYEAGSSGDGVHQLEMQGSAPAIVLMLSVDVLLLLSKHEPVEAHHDKVAHNGHGIEEMVSSLNVDGSFGGLQAVLAEVSSVFRCADAANQRNGRQHQGPVCEGDEESVPVHVEAVSDIA